MDRISLSGFGGTTIQPFAQFLAGAEKRRPLFAHRHRLAGARIAAHARRPDLHGKSAKAAQFHAMAISQRLGNAVQHRRDDAFHIAVVKVRIARGKPRNQFRLDHPSPWGVKTGRVTPPGLIKLSEPPCPVNGNPLKIIPFWRSGSGRGTPAPPWPPLHALFLGSPARFSGPKPHG